MMTLKNEDIKAIKVALEPQFQRIQSRLVIVEKKLASLEKKMETVELNVTKKIDQQRVETSMALGDLVEKVATQSELNELRGRVTSLEYLQKTAGI